MNNTQEHNLKMIKGLALIFASLFQFIFIPKLTWYLIGVWLVGPFYLFILCEAIISGSKIQRNNLNGNAFKLYFLDRFKQVYIPMAFWTLFGLGCFLLFNSSGAFGTHGTLPRDVLAIWGGVFNLFKSLGSNQSLSAYYSVFGTYWHINFEDQFLFGYLLLVLLLRNKSNLRKALILGGLVSSCFLFFRNESFFNLVDLPENLRSYFLMFSPSRNIQHVLLGFFIIELVPAINRFRINLSERVKLTFIFSNFLIIVFYFLSLREFSGILTSDIFNKDYYIVLWFSEFLLGIGVISLKSKIFETSKLLNFLSDNFYPLYLGHVVCIRLVEQINFSLFNLRGIHDELSAIHKIGSVFLSLFILIIFSFLISNIRARLCLQRK